MAGLAADVIWRAGGRALDARLLGLLRALQRNATLKAAAEAQDISYRAAWGLLLEAAELAGAPLVELRRGRGARLTRFGTQLLRYALPRAMTRCSPRSAKASPCRRAWWRKSLSAAARRAWRCSRAARSSSPASISRASTCAGWCSRDATR